MSVMMVPSQAEDFYDTGYKSWYHGKTNVSIPDVNMLKNSSTLTVSVPIFIKFGFVSVNGPRENYFVDALCRFCLDFDLFKPDAWFSVRCLWLYSPEFYLRRDIIFPVISNCADFVWHVDEILLQIFWFAQFIGSSCYLFTIIDVDSRLHSFIQTCVS